MYSMTGYGKGEYGEEGLTVSVEVRSVNNRYLDIAVKAPRILLCAEDTIRSVVREYLSRGHIDIFISYTDKRERAKPLYVDWGVIQAYMNAAAEIKRAYPLLEDDGALSFFLRLPDAIRTDDTVGADELLLSCLDRALRLALASLSEMRKGEGERLKEDLLSRMGTIVELRGKIADRAPLISEEYREKIASRIEEFLGGKVDEARILTEAALFADKCNIDEELTRLRSHIDEYYRICETEPVGRKLDFLIQEFNRECNTICSKSCDTEITADALAMKNEIEKIREQIQNLE